MQLSQRKKLLALLICGLLFTSGPVRPILVSANDGEEIMEVDDESGDESSQSEAPAEDDSTAETDPESEAQTDSSDDVEDEAVSTAAAVQGEDEKVSGLEAQISSLNDKIESLKAETKKIEANIANAKTEQEKALAVQNGLDRQITSTTEQIAYLQQRISLLEQDIEIKEQTILLKQKEIDYNNELLKKRIRAQYMNDDGTMLGLLVTADSFSDFLTHSEYMVRIAKHDQDLMEKLTAERISVEEDKAALEADKVQIEVDKQDTESQKQDLSKQYSAAALMVQEYASMEDQFNADLEKNKAMRAQMEAEIDNIYKQIEMSKNPYVGGEMAWPLPGYWTISSEYGSRFGGSDFHTGMDITGGGCFGAQIVAANDGVVKFVNTAYTDGVGYGKYVIVDHGGNTSTLYAHCSELLVSLGQEVKKGEAIAKVGNTGWSTGPHVHFEVRQGSSHVNPKSYVIGG